MTRRIISARELPRREGSEPITHQADTSALTAVRTTAASRASFLECLYSIYADQGAHAHTDSKEVGRRCSMVQEVVYEVAVELHKRKLVSFCVCDEGLVNMHLTPDGIHLLKNPLSEADWHPRGADGTLGKMPPAKNEPSGSKS